MRTASFPTLSFITIHCSSGSEGCPGAIKHHTSNVALCIRCGPRQEVFGQHLRPTMKQRDFFFNALCQAGHSVQGNRRKTGAGLRVGEEVRNICLCVCSESDLS